MERSLFLILILLISYGMTGGSGYGDPVPDNGARKDIGGLSFILPGTWNGVLEDNGMIRLLDTRHPEWSLSVSAYQGSGEYGEISALSALHRMMISDGALMPDEIADGERVSGDMYRASGTDEHGWVHYYYIREIEGVICEGFAITTLKMSRDDLKIQAGKIMSGIIPLEKKDPDLYPLKNPENADMNITFTDDSSVIRLDGTVSGVPLPSVLWLWVIGDDMRSLRVIPISQTGIIRSTIPVSGLPSTDYYLFLQHPGQNGIFDLYPDDATYPAVLYMNSTMGSRQVMVLTGKHAGVSEAVISVMSWVVDDSDATSVDDLYLWFNLDPTVLSDSEPVNICTGQC